jgi:pimeloyl-ACP methyl ester carboxylesterase
MTAATEAQAMPEVPGVEHRWVDAGGLNVHLAEAGAGEPLVMLHGWPQHWFMWRKVVPALAERYRVICPDLRGFGWTDATPSGYGKEELTDDVLRLLEVLKLDRVRLVGHDWGGWIGFLLCLREPDRVERYVALNIAPPWGEPTARNALETLRFWYMAVLAAPAVGERAVSRGRLVERLLRWSADERAWTDDELRAFTEPLREPARARATTLLYRTFLTSELPGMVTGRYHDQRLRTPTLLMFGTKDKAIGTSLVTGHERHADDLRLELVHSAGHWIAEEEPELVASRALAFFGENA